MADLTNLGTTFNQSGQNTEVKESKENTETTEEDEPIVNKYNEFTHYWSPEDEEMKMSTDTPTVRIFISHEIVPDEELDDVMEVDEASAKSYSRKAFMMASGLDKEKNAIVKVNNSEKVAYKSIDTNVKDKVKSLRGH